MPSKDNETGINNGTNGTSCLNGGLNGSLTNGCTNNTDEIITRWNPLHSTDVDTFPVGRYAVVILNRPVLVPPKLMVNLWNNANVRLTVDGGTARWYQFCEDVKNSDLNINCVHPDIISGDFDSIPKAVMDIVKKNGCEIIQTPDQEHTDFRKSLQVLHDKDFEIDTVIAVAENSGRLDHTLANINTHFVLNSIFTKRQVHLYSLASDSITWLLRPGKHSISIPKRLRDKSTWCSLLPVGQGSNITTSGLFYNMYDRRLEFGILVSSSNTYSGEEEVVIETDGNVIWSMGLGFLSD